MFLFPAAMNIRAIPKATALAIGMLMLAGCTNEIVPRECPRVAPLADAMQRTVFLPDAEARADAIVADLRFLGVERARCDYDEDEVEVSFVTVIEAERGPAWQGRRIELPFFVAILDNRLNLLGKQVFQAELEFRDGAALTRREEALRQTIFLPGPLATGSAYQVLFGFELTEADLAFNRARLGRTLTQEP